MPAEHGWLSVLGLSVGSRADGWQTQTQGQESWLHSSGPSRPDICDPTENLNFFGLSSATGR